MTTKRAATVRRSSDASEWADLWFAWLQTAWLVPQVVVYRTTAAMTGGWPPNAQGRREYARMFWEKPEAFTEAMLAVAGAPLFGAAQMQAALAPYSRRVGANQRRLAGARRTR